MSRLPTIVHRIRALQGEETAWRDKRPELAFSFTALDLLTACGFQYYSDHFVGDDVVLLDRAVTLLPDSGPPEAAGPFEEASRASVRALDVMTSSLRRRVGDLDAEDLLRVRLVAVPARTLLGRVDEESAPDLACWNEANGLIEGISLPYRCASRISALGYWSAPDRYRVIDHMVAYANGTRPSPRTGNALTPRSRRRRGITSHGSAPQSVPTAPDSEIGGNGLGVPCHDTRRRSRGRVAATNSRLRSPCSLCAGP